MKTALKVIGGLLILAGGIWFLQGINMLPGSLMSGQIQWAVYGTIAAVGGIILIVWANRRKRPR